MKWSDESTAELKRLFTDEKKTVREAAALMGVTPGSAAGKLHRMGLVGNIYARAYRQRPARRSDYDHNRGNWDVRTFEPYALFKARKQREREHALR